MYLLTPAEMRSLEDSSERHGVSKEALMEHAGKALAEFILKQSADPAGKVVFLCGSGNNGGDGLVAARLLSEMGIKAYVIFLCKRLSTDLAIKNSERLKGTKAEIIFFEEDSQRAFEILNSADVIADCVFGTGFHGELPPEVLTCFAHVSRCGGVKIAADAPSGGNCLTGEAAIGTLSCDYTVTFGCKKAGLVKAPLKGLCGEVVPVEIGIPKECFGEIKNPVFCPELKEIKALLPIRPIDSHKGMFGRVLILAGSKKMPGACGLCAKAALRSGAGLLVTATAESAAKIIASRIFESTYLPLKETDDGMIAKENIPAILEEAKKADVIALGCGLGVSEDTKEVVKAVLENAECTVILDADGINCIQHRIDIIRNTKASLILTPHIGELARLLRKDTREIKEKRLDCALQLAKEYGVTVAAKGVPTYTVSQSGLVWANSTGNPGLSRGGSGDVLTGIIAGLCAQGLPPHEGAFAGVYLHGKAADLAAKKRSVMGMLPSDVIDELPYLFLKMNR